MKTIPLLVITIMLVGLVGCLSIKTPDRIDVGSHNRLGRVDSSRVPPTRNHADAREKLAEAYARIRDLEDEVADLEEDKRELEKDKRELERKLDRYDD